MGVKVHQTLKFHIDDTLKLAQWKIVTGCHGVFTIFNTVNYNIIMATPFHSHRQLILY